MRIHCDDQAVSAVGSMPVSCNNRSQHTYRHTQRSNLPALFRKRQDGTRVGLLQFDCCSPLTIHSSRTFAFVAHQSLSLNDSRVVHITSQAKKIALFGWKDGELRADIRVDWAPLKAGNADEALCSFCQKIWLRGLATDPGTLAGSSIVAQNLFQAFDNKLSFKREMLSFGLQGLQELDWSKQNAVLMDDNQRTKQSANESRVRFGPDDRFLLDIDTGMLEARGVVKFKIHDMNIEQPQQKKSYQLFVDVKHTDFVQAFGDEVKGQPNPWVCTKNI